MKIRITHVDADTQPRVWVAFSCGLGEGHGRWRSPETPPTGEHHVELEFPEPVQAFRVLPVAAPPSFTRNGDLVAVTAEVLAAPSAPDDPVVTVLLGGDAVLLELEAAAATTCPPPGTCITFTATALDVYPYDL